MYKNVLLTGSNMFDVFKLPTAESGKLYKYWVVNTEELDDIWDEKNDDLFTSREKILKCSIGSYDTQKEAETVAWIKTSAELEKFDTTF